MKLAMEREVDATAPRVLVVGNYAPDAQNSMRLYARTLVENLGRLGVRVDAIEPPAVAARLTGRSARLAKLAGYLDKYLFFPVLLRWRARRYDSVHIADHSNAPYRAVVGSRPVIVTCHDLFAVQIMRGEVDGQRFGRTGRMLQRAVAAALTRADRIVCVSDASAAELRRLTATTAPISIIPNALSPFYHSIEIVESAAELTKLGLDSAAPYFLHVGGNQYYKNRPGVVRLFECLAADPDFKEHRLVLAGKPPDAALDEALARSPVRDRIDVIVTPGDVAVRALYNRAVALLFVSLQEGFGWPILEAQACGCPVVISDGEPMRSVAGGAALLIDPSDPEAGARVIAAAAPRIDALRAAGLENAAAYAPNRVYPRYLPLYGAAAGEAPHRAGQ